MTMSNIALLDGKASPATHTFVPQSQQAGKTPALWVNKVTGFGARAWERLTTLVNISQDEKQPHRTSAQIHLPKVILVDGIETVVGNRAIFISTVCDYNVATVDDFKDIFALGKNFCANAEATSIFVDQKPSG